MKQNKKSLSQKIAGATSRLSKKVSARTKKPLSEKKIKKPSVSMELSHDSIALRAYYISERRRELCWYGDEQTDWIEAEKQLLAEAFEK